MKLYAWQGPDLFELAFVDVRDDRLTARGTQLRSAYRLTHVVETSHMFVSELLRAEVETVHGIGTLDLRRGTKPLRDASSTSTSRARRCSTRCPFFVTGCTREPAMRASTRWRS